MAVGNLAWEEQGRKIMKNPLDLSAGYLDWIGMRIAGEKLY
jgi:hypothetical protein